MKMHIFLLCSDYIRGMVGTKKKNITTQAYSSKKIQMSRYKSLSFCVIY